MTSQFSSDQIISQLDQAKQLALTQPETHAQVFRQILPFTSRPELPIKQWCVEFIHDTFLNSKVQLRHGDKVDLAIDSLDSLIGLSNSMVEIHDFCQVINISNIIYKLVFQYVCENDGCNQIWSKLIELKNSLVNKFQTNYPLKESDNAEHDILRNVITKLELLKFIMTVVDYQSKTQIVGSSNGSGTVTTNFFSLDRVPINHTLIKYQNMEYEAVNLLDLILKTLTQDILNPPMISATLNIGIILLKRKPQYAGKVLKLIENFDTNAKFQSNYQTIEQFKLAKKYIDRNLKIFIQHGFKYGLIPTNFQSNLNKKLQLLIERGNEIRKKNIFIEDSSNIKKRKFEGFLNPSKRIKTADYKNLYTLNDLNNELNNFDLTTVPQHILVSMVMNALDRASVPKLTKALEIISERYTSALSSRPAIPVAQPVKQEVAVKTQVKRLAESDEESDSEQYNPEAMYTLPPPKDLSFQDKKLQIELIIKNFFKLAKGEVKPEDIEPGSNSDELTKIAIKSWKKDSWILLLSRLVTRGMRRPKSKSEEDEDSYDVETSPDDTVSQEMGDLVRNAIFDYFLENIHGRIDIIIEWLNEEWYSEVVFNEANNIKTNNTPIYDKWAGKVLDAMIPFLEPNDKKIFIRLLSDLPQLNQDLLSKIKSLCFDPARSTIGFLALAFLIMYRPPVKQGCLQVLQELSECDQEDVKQEAKKRLEKFQ
ncbi:mRNA cleavage and polyadenylation specificity factor complex subunit pta1 [Spathaspora sp. JA1]|nr:mRNA cleavage and polyadenylation specificity factor complex subunit pta1 [Spathaspora sp. JA1]